MFNWIAGAWALMPLLLLCAISWGVIELSARVGPVTALTAAAVLILTYPASIAILAMTHSAIGSINPVAVVTLIRICGPRYLIIPGVVILVAAGLYFLDRAGAPHIVVEFSGVYLFFLLFSLTGAVVGESEVSKYVENPDPVAPEEEAVEAQAEKNRARILDHAYGLLSRGNRDGGLVHIQSYLHQSVSVADDYRWFFDAMLRWEDNQHALFFAQHYLHYLLNANEAVLALKLLSRCMLENPRFRPLPEDLARVRELAADHARDDLSRQLS